MMASVSPAWSIAPTCPTMPHTQPSPNPRRPALRECAHAESSRRGGAGIRFPKQRVPAKALDGDQAFAYRGCGVELSIGEHEEIARRIVQVEIQIRGRSGGRQLTARIELRGMRRLDEINESFCVACAKRTILRDQRLVRMGERQLRNHEQ